MSQSNCETLIHAFISSRIDMSNALFFGLPKSTLHKLQRIQNAAVRVIFSLKKRESVRDHIKSLHWLNIEQRIVFKTLLLVFKSLHNLTPSVLAALISVKDMDTLTLDVKSFFPTSELGRRAFRYSAPRLWNCLSFKIRSSKTVDAFKSLLKTYLFTSFSDFIKLYNRYL